MSWQKNDSTVFLCTSLLEPKIAFDRNPSSFRLHITSLTIQTQTWKYVNSTVSIPNLWISKMQILRISRFAKLSHEYWYLPFQSAEPCRYKLADSCAASSWRIGNWKFLLSFIRRRSSTHRQVEVAVNSSMSTFRLHEPEPTSFLLSSFCSMWIFTERSLGTSFLIFRFLHHQYQFN